MRIVIIQASFAKLPLLHTAEYEPIIDLASSHIGFLCAESYYANNKNSMHSKIDVAFLWSFSRRLDNETPVYTLITPETFT